MFEGAAVLLAGFALETRQAGPFSAFRLFLAS